MENGFKDSDLEQALNVLRKGGTILYPTDTIWGLGCDATNESAIEQIYKIKQRPDSKALIMLVAAEGDILKYVADPDPAVFDFIENTVRPTTIIFNNAVGLPENLVAGDGSVAIRLVKDNFCRHLIKRLQKPIISTSANLTGQASPRNFKDIHTDLKTQVDYVVQWRQEATEESRPSQIIKWEQNGSYTVIRP